LLSAAPLRRKSPVTIFMAHTAQGGALLGRLWLMARFGCCVQVFNDYVAEVTVVRALCFTVSRSSRRCYEVYELTLHS
jgi:hypothetical protein